VVSAGAEKGEVMSLQPLTDQELYDSIVIENSKGALSDDGLLHGLEDQLLHRLVDAVYKEDWERAKALTKMCVEVETFPFSRWCE